MDKYDQIIDINEKRILTQWEPGKEVQINNRVDAFHKNVGWLEARVLEKEDEFDEKLNKIVTKKVKVHYFNYHEKYDQWLDFNNR